MRFSSPDLASISPASAASCAFGLRGLFPAVCQLGVQGVDLLLPRGKGRPGLLHGGFQPLALCFGPHTVVGGSDLLTAGGGQLCVQGICLLFALVGLFLSGKAFLLQFRSLDTQLLQLLLAGEQTRAALDAAAGKAAARVDDLTVQRDHLVAVTSSRPRGRLR